MCDSRSQFKIFKLAYRLYLKSSLIVYSNKYEIVTDKKSL